MSMRISVDFNGNPQATGVQSIIHQLEKTFGALGVETRIIGIIELLTFRRAYYESIDDALTRFE
eukprot:4162028-Karenia_brevis.AAC.1